MLLPPPSSTLFPYTTLFRSLRASLYKTGGIATTLARRHALLQVGRVRFSWQLPSVERLLTALQLWALFLRTVPLAHRITKDCGFQTSICPSTISRVLLFGFGLGESVGALLAHTILPFGQLRVRV